MLGIKRLKTWWKSTAPEEKILCVLGGIITVISGGTCLYCMDQVSKMKKETVQAVEGMKVEITLYPEGQKLDRVSKQDLDDENKPCPAGDVPETPYEQAKALREAIENMNENICEIDQDVIDDIRQKSLQLTWDLAAKEDKLDDANEHIPYQLYD